MSFFMPVFSALRRGIPALSHRQMQRLDDGLKNGRIDQKEYDIRKDQMERGSIIY